MQARQASQASLAAGGGGWREVGGLARLARSWRLLFIPGWLWHEAPYIVERAGKARASCPFPWAALRGPAQGKLAGPRED